MQYELIGYLLNALEEEEVNGLEALLTTNRVARQQLELLRFALTPLGNSAPHDEPPRDLGIRTCELLREFRRA